jgi:hypothetical protein
MQLSRVERFQQKIVATGLDPFQAVAAVGLGRYDDHGNEPSGTVLFQPAAELVAVPARGYQVDKDEIGGLLGARVQSRIDRGRDRDCVPFTAEQPAQKSDAYFIVVRNKDVCVSHHQDARHLQKEGR